MLVAGAFTEEPLGAAFVFTNRATHATVNAFVAGDPYVKAGLVTEYIVQEWAVPVLHAAVDAATNF